MTDTENNWSNVEKLIFKLSFCWVTIFCCSFSFPHQFLPDIGKYTASFFEIPVKWFAKSILHLNKPYTSTLISDSTGLYIQSFLVLLYALFATLTWTLIDKNRRSYTFLMSLFFTGIRYYLALQFFTYGFSKLFKWQFYLPEPNTLFTTIGETPKDLLYWTAMGASRSYTIFSGVVEIIAACLLLFRRSFIAGALLAAGIMINVTAINFGFDISVKLYSLLLLLLCIVLLVPFIRQLIKFFLFQQAAKLDPPSIVFNKQHRKWYALAKAIVIILIITDPLSIYIKENNFNDDTAPRPLLHGAYEVDSFTADEDTLAPLTTDTIRWSKVFVHRKGYFIIQYMDGAMQDHELQYDTINKYLVITDYEKENIYTLHYQQKPGNIIELTGEWGEKYVDIKLRKTDLNKLPLMEKEFNWTIDD